VAVACGLTLLLGIAGSGLEADNRIVDSLPAGAAAAQALARGEADAVLHFSRRSARLFAACAAKAGLASQAAGLRHVCISRDAALGEGAVIAPTPDSAGLFKALEQM
jgi:uroporphyrinogen-III synthase